jgi:uncharacterized membrane protein
MIGGERLLAIGVLGAALAGLGISAYLSAVHAGQAPLVCSVRGPVDCERVLTSAYAQILGTAIPTSAAGILWFGVSGVLALLQIGLWRERAALLAGLAWSVAGLLTALFLVYVEIVQLGALCAWCSVAHALVLLTLLFTLARLERLPRAQPEPHGTAPQP